MTARILLAEDEEHIARLIEFKLRKEGFDVTIARNGQEAVERFSGGEWALLILDVMMPVLDGWEVLKQVRASEAGKRLPILMLTAKGRQSDAASAAELGATQFLRKPFDPAELASIARKLTGS